MQTNEADFETHIDDIVKAIGDKLERSVIVTELKRYVDCLLYTSPSPRDLSTSRMPSSA